MRFFLLKMSHEMFLGVAFNVLRCRIRGIDYQSFNPLYFLTSYYPYNFNKHINIKSIKTHFRKHLNLFQVFSKMHERKRGYLVRVLPLLNSSTLSSIFSPFKAISNNWVLSLGEILLTLLKSKFRTLSASFTIV